MDTTALAERLEELRDELADYSKGLRGQGVAKPCNTTDIAALTEAATRLRALATVTDEDVERACEVFYADNGWRTNVNRSRDFMRAALESFANKEPTDE